MVEFVHNFLFGLAFGCGFLIAYAVLMLIASLAGQAILFRPAGKG